MQFPFDKLGNWGFERLNNLFEVMALARMVTINMEASKTLTEPGRELNPSIQRQVHNHVATLPPA